MTVADANEDKRGFAEQLGATWVSPAEALTLEADVLAPCALGRVLDRETVSRLRVRVVAGAANNQLADDSIADALRDRGIVWAPDFIINAGGLIAVADELHGFDLGRVERAIERIADTLSEVYAVAERDRTNTLTAAKRVAGERLQGYPEEVPERVGGIEGPSRT